MKIISVSVLSLACILGLLVTLPLTTEGYGMFYPATGYGHYGQRNGGFGDGGFLWLIGLLFIIVILFSNNSFFNRTSSGVTVTTV